MKETIIYMIDHMQDESLLQRIYNLVEYLYLREGVK